MKKIGILLAFICCGAGTVLAQDYSSLHYDMGIPLGSTSNAVSKMSFRGIGFDYRQGVSDAISIGISLGWQTFYERKDKATYTDGAVSLTGVQFSYVNAVPMHINATHYFASEDAPMRPYIGFGVGTTYFERRIDMGVYTTNTKNWQFSIQPEVGLLYELSSGANLLLGAKYTQGFKNADLDAQSYIAITVGGAWKL